MKWLTAILIIGLFSFSVKTNNYIEYKTTPSGLKFFYKDAQGLRYGTFERLNIELKKKNQQLAFAINGGMFLADYSPCGLYVEDGKVLRKLNKYSKSGVFYITKNDKAIICSEQEITEISNIKYATQSLPLLVANGQINSRLKKDSKTVFIRNGVGVLPTGEVIFIISYDEINLYEFANLFKKRGCTNALYLDGAISEMYWPEKDLTNSYNYFGVFIGVTKRL